MTRHWRFLNVGADLQVRPAHSVSCCVLAICAALAGAACDWPWRHDMVDQPSIAAAASARAPAAGTIAVGGELPIATETAEQRLVNPIDAAAPTDVGRELYRSYCVPCHGVSGGGDGPVAKYFPPMPRLDADAIHTHTDGWMFGVITNGTAQMPRFAFELTPPERWQIVHFVRARAGATAFSSDTGDTASRDTR